MPNQSEELNELNFTGEIAEEAEDFIQSVNKRAYAAGRQKDNAWIAEFASPFFSRKALRWYESLDEETQNNWQLLKRAILAEFTASPPAPATVPSAAPALVSSPSSATPAAPPPSAVTVKVDRTRVDSEDHTKGGYFRLLRRAILGEVTASPPAPATVPSAAPALVSSPSNPTPAAPPPSAVTVKIGRIRVDSEDHTQGGYLWISTQCNNVGVIVANSRKANIFEVDTLARTLRFKGSRESLVIRGESQDCPLSPQTARHGVMKKSSELSGTQWNHTWSITEDGNITAMLLRTDGSRRDASFLVESLDVGGAIHVPADKEMFLECWANSYTRVTLHFEALS